MPSPLAEERALLQRQIVALEKRLSYEQLAQYKPYPKQLEFHSAGGDAHVMERLLVAGNQLGKEERFDEPVLTPRGWVAIGELKKGDPVIAGDGSVTFVKGVFPQGIKPLVEIEFCYGQKVVVGHEHRWLVQTPATRFTTTSKSFPIANGKRPSVSTPNPRHGEWEVLTTAQMRAKYGDNPAPKYRYATPAVGPCHFDDKPVGVDPYVLGVLLGDGGLTNGIVVSSADAAIIAAVRAEAERHGGKLKHKGRYDYGVSFAPDLKLALVELDVLGHGAATKRVPHSYLWNSVEVRLAVLQGLMDTDGTCEKSGVTTFTSISKGLAEDVQFLARSFGGKVLIKSRVPTYTYKGEKRVGQRAYTVTIRLPHVPLFRLERKLARYVRPTSTTDHNLIVAFRDVEPAEAVCISVEHPSQLYVTRGFIVTHNTMSASMEAAMHATGRYPSWWPGIRFAKPTVGWAASETSQGTRDTVQRMLLGTPGIKTAEGTGAIPKADIIEVKKATHGVSDSIETILVKHVTGGTSRIVLKTYDQGRERWQGDTLNWVWFDEEPPEDIYIEGKTRTIAVGGVTFMTFTPLKGMSTVVKRFLQEKAAGTHTTTMTIEDALHISPERRAIIIAGYPSHERDARARGIPILGEGRIFPFDDEMIAEPALQVPAFWPRICGLDFGYAHPTAAVWLAWDRDTDIVHGYDCYRRKEATPVVHAAAIAARGKWIPAAWPHDGGTRDSRGSGVTLAQQYRELGVNTLKVRATHPPSKGQREGDGGNSLEAGITEMFDRFQTGRLKIAKHLSVLFEEIHLYHRKDGLVVAEGAAALRALRVALMMLRKAEIQQRPKQDTVIGWAPTVPGMGMLG